MTQPTQIDRFEVYSRLGRLLGVHATQAEAELTDEAHRLVGVTALGERVVIQERAKA